jgi:hypothetical protein
MATIISLTIVSSFVVPAFGIKDFRFLKVPPTIIPTWIDPTTGVARAWVVKAGGYARPFPMWGIFFMIAPALGGTLLGFLDQNLTEVLVNRKDRMFKKPPAYHLTNFICGTILYPACAVLGLPPTHAATVRSLAHVMAVTTTEVVQLPDGGGTTVRVVNVAEQRVTHLAIHVLIWLSLAATSALAYVRRRAARRGALLARPDHALRPLASCHAPLIVTLRAGHVSRAASGLRRSRSPSSSASSSTSASRRSAATRCSTASPCCSLSRRTSGPTTTTCRRSTGAR